MSDNTLDAKGIPLNSQYGKINTIKIRKEWEINPKTRVVPNKKKYNKQKDKLNIKKMLKEEDF